MTERRILTDAELIEALAERARRASEDLETQWLASKLTAVADVLSHHVAGVSAAILVRCRALSGAGRRALVFIRRTGLCGGIG